jgi:anti-sigma factor RsiW
MECERCNAKLSAYADGKLSAREARHVRAHLAACRRCREDLSELSILRALLRALPEPEPSPGFWNHTHLMVRQKAAARPRAAWELPKWHYGWSAAAATLLIVLLASVPRRLDHTPVSTSFVNPAALVSLHASAHAGRPLADLGTLRYAYTEADAQDLADDDQLDAD